MKKLWSWINLPRSIPALILFHRLPCRKDIQADLRRKCNADHWQALHNAMLHDPLFRKWFYFRTFRDAPMLTKLSKLLYKPFRTMEIDAEHIGGGAMTYHGYSTIVFAKSIGANFTVYQQVTIGRGKRINGNDIPIIGNNVTVYAGAIIVGGITIGDGATIGAGAVVVKDVPAKATVVGAPSRILEKSE